MAKPLRVAYCWSILWRSNNSLDGPREYLVGIPDGKARTLLFPTRKAARDYNDCAFGYIRESRDLKAEPYGWKMPRVVRVKVEITREDR